MHLSYYVVTFLWILKQIYVSYGKHDVISNFKGRDKKHPLQMSRVSDGEGNGTPLQYPCLENPMDRGAWWAAVHGVTKSQTQLNDFTFTFHFHALEKEMAAHSSGLAWRIPGTGEPGGLPSMGSPRVGHDWSNLAAAAGSVNKGIRANYPQMMVIRSYLGIREQSHEELLSKIKMENNNTWWHTSPGYSFCFYEILLRPPSRLNSL